MRRIELLFLCGVFFCGCNSAVRTNKTIANLPRTARTQVERGPVRVMVEVSPEPARLSDEPQLTLTIDHEPGIEVKAPPFGSAVGAFIVRDFREPLPQSDGKRQIVRQIYTLEPTQAGPLSIDPIVVTFIDKRPNGDGQEHRVETESLTLNVISTLDQQSLSLAQLKGPQGPVPLPPPAMSQWWWIAGAGMAACAGAVAWFFYRRKRISSMPPPSPRELAERELTALWGSNTARAEVKLFYVELTGIVRRYIERTTDIHAPEQTTEEFLREISQAAGFTRNERQRLKDFLESADLVKFAAHQPVYTDIEESFRRAKVFVGLVPREEQPA